MTVGVDETSATGPCWYCEEALVSEPAAVEVGSRWMHSECAARLVLGSVGHQKRKCPCYVTDGPTEDDPPGTTLRQGAIAAHDFARSRAQALLEGDIPDALAHLMTMFGSGGEGGKDGGSWGPTIQRAAPSPSAPPWTEAAKNISGYARKQMPKGAAVIVITAAPGQGMMVVANCPGLSVQSLLGEALERMAEEAGEGELVEEKRPQ